MSLKQRTISGIFWSVLQNVGSKGILFLATIILARLLTPSEFGLIGMLTIFINISLTVISAGFNQALIQKKDASDEDYSTIFWLNLAVSILLYVLLFTTAPLIASFYKQPILTKMCRVLSFIFIINALSYVQETRLMKEMKFKTLMVINIPSTIVSAGISVALAYLGFGVWSIISLQLLNRLFYSVQLWINARWRPRPLFNKDSAKQLFSFGGKLMLSSIIHTFYQNIYLVIIGKFFPLEAVGYYQNSNNIVQYPVNTITGAVNSVAFSAFSTIQDDDIKLKEGYKKMMQQAMFILVPFFVLSAIMAVPLFTFLFTKKWLPAVPYFQILSVVGILYPLNYFNLMLVNVKGRSDIFLKLEIVKKVIISIGLLITVRYGIWALLIFQAINPVFSYFLNSFYSGKFIGYPVREQLKDFYPILLINGIMGITVFFLNTQLAYFSNLSHLLIGYGVGLTFYLLASRIIRLDPYFYLLQLLLNLPFKRLQHKI